MLIMLNIPVITRNLCNNHIVQSDIPPEISVLEKLKTFYDNVAKIAALVNFAFVFTSDGIHERV